MSYLISIVIPIFKNESSISLLLDRVREISRKANGNVEAIFVIDGSPDRSLEFLQSSLPQVEFDAKLLLLSRNFGSFSAIRAGLREACGVTTVVMAADLQEPISLVESLLELVVGHEVDVAVGVRQSRRDSFLSRVLSASFWRIFNRLTTLEMPKGGVDIFALSKSAREQINEFEESSTSLVGLIYWIGFKRQEVLYHREKRSNGKSSWSLRKKVNYAKDSITAFSELPLSIFLWSGVFGAFVALALIFALIFSMFFNEGVDIGRQILAIAALFFFSYLMSGLGILGTYLWRVADNVRKRPDSIIWKKWNIPASGHK
jgi:glycosyltransferase involved in cell wall biosynthesis